MYDPSVRVPPGASRPAAFAGTLLLNHDGYGHKPHVYLAVRFEEDKMDVGFVGVAVVVEEQCPRECYLTACVQRNGGW